MKRIKPIFAVALLALIIGAGAVAIWIVFRPSSRQIGAILSSGSIASNESTENSVYSALLESELVEDHVKLLVISDRTLSVYGTDYLQSTTADQRVQEMKKAYPSVAEDTLFDFDTNNRQPSKLSVDFNLSVKYVLIDNCELERYSKVTNIRLFYEKYPNAGAVARVSKIGFNKNWDEAFVEVESIFCALCGFGERVLLKKESGEWRVAETFLLWIS